MMPIISARNYDTTDERKKLKTETKKNKDVTTKLLGKNKG